MTRCSPKAADIDPTLGRCRRETSNRRRPNVLSPSGAKPMRCNGHPLIVAMHRPSIIAMHHPSIIAMHPGIREPLSLSSIFSRSRGTGEACNLHPIECHGPNTACHRLALSGTSWHILLSERSVESHGRQTPPFPSDSD